MARIDLACARWRKSSHSAQATDCVELAPVQGVVAVRDSKDPHGPALMFTGPEWRSFLARVTA